MTTAELRALVLAEIERKPGTFTEIVNRLGGNDVYRAVDRTLQWLRRAGKIECKRSGSRVVWSVKRAANPNAPTAQEDSK